MSKSNKEKERLAKVRSFKNGEIGFDTSMLKLKLNFYLSGLKLKEYPILKVGDEFQPYLWFSFAFCLLFIR